MVISRQFSCKNALRSRTYRKNRSDFSFAAAFTLADAL
jgi:hypothetical protein